MTDVVVDTSAIMAVLLDEPERPRLEEVLRTQACAMSAVTRVEVGIVVEARNGPAGTLLLEDMLTRLGVDVVPVDAAQAAEAMACWRRYGKGRHPAALNLGDVFSYTLARRLGCPLLFVGDDFGHTDVRIIDEAPGRDDPSGPAVP